jgi:hypothetical protein
MRLKYSNKLTKFLNGKALNEAFENKYTRIKLRKFDLSFRPTSDPMTNAQ